MFDQETLSELERIVAKYKAQHDSRGFDYTDVLEGYGNMLAGVLRSDEEWDELCGCKEWYEQFVGEFERTALNRYPGWQFHTFYDRIIDEVHEFGWEITCQIMSDPHINLHEPGTEEFDALFYEISNEVQYELENYLEKHVGWMPSNL